MKGSRVALLVLIVTLIVLALPPVQMRLLASLATINVLVTDGAWRPLQWATRAPEQQDHAITSVANDELRVRLYRPRPLFSGQPTTALVINTPFIGGGLDDPRLVNLAETFTRAGFVVALPWQEKSALLVNAEDTEAVVAAAQFALTEEPALTRLGLFGISYGNGPIFAAAADPRLADQVEFIISLNGYSDLAEVITFINSGTSHSYPREILEANLATRGQSLETYLASADFAKLREALSPSEQLNKISAELFIIHSTADTFIPFEQSVKLHEVASAHAPSSLILTDVIEHGTYRLLTWRNLSRYYLPAARDFMAAITTILQHR